MTSKYKYHFMHILLLFISSQSLCDDSIKSDSIFSFDKDSVTIHIIKDQWHTAFVIPVNDSLVSHLPAVKHFKEFNVVDIGWGDEEFFQAPSTDAYLAAKAILYPTDSVVRIAGMSRNTDRIIKWVDYCVELKISAPQYLKLCKFINESFQINNDSTLIITSKRPSGEVIFFKSNLKYHLFYTCNTWIGRALESIGYDIDTSGLITAEQLFYELVEIGTVLKFEN